jgi:hypothetical protein
MRAAIVLSPLDDIGKTILLKERKFKSVWYRSAVSPNGEEVPGESNLSLDDLSLYRSLKLDLTMRASNDENRSGIVFGVGRSMSYFC